MIIKSGKRCERIRIVKVNKYLFRQNTNNIKLTTNFKEIKLKHTHYTFVGGEGMPLNE